MTHTFIAYTRISSPRGDAGVSLQEQRRAIQAFATRQRFTITAWYEERTTAAKRGRPVFTAVMKTLRRKHGRVGLLIHKIDRGARNLRDWADLGEAIDHGIPVRFAHDDVDLCTRAGRLTADIQAVIAADYIRNLREEVKKGIAGRLRQGLYPFKAPRGYRDRGRGRAKTPDPIDAPLIVAAFKRFATGRYTLCSLAEELAVLGLTGRTNRPLRPGTLAKVLRNRFYRGECVAGAEVHEGVHQPLVTGELFDDVQRELGRRGRIKRVKHWFQYRRCLRCRGCGHHLLGERHGPHIYYRCHECPKVCVREDRIERLAATVGTWQLEDPSRDRTLPIEIFDTSLEEHAARA